MNYAIYIGIHICRYYVQKITYIGDTNFTKMLKTPIQIRSWSYINLILGMNNAYIEYGSGTKERLNVNAMDFN